MYKEILIFKNSRQAFFELSCARLSELYNAASLFKGWSQIPINPEKIHKRVKKHEIFPVLIVVPVETIPNSLLSTNCNIKN